jgi:hypothetical protein
MKTYSVSTTPALEKLFRGTTNWMRLLPDFIVIGAQRAGTTSLYNYLVALPNIYPASIKEVHFFDKKFNKGIAWYRAHFPLTLQKYYVEHIRKQGFITGEACPYYLFHPHVPKRAASVLPQVKLIVLLRNPVDRAFSEYNFEVDGGRETLSFEEAINCEEERTAQEREKMAKDEHYYSFDHQFHSYLARGIYVDQLRTWMEHFPRENFLILKSESFYADPAAAIKQTLDFLNLPGMEPNLKKKEYKQYNNKTFTKRDATLRKRLIEYFEPHNARLYDLLGVNFGWDQ